jgi:hypothetical protein
MPGPPQLAPLVAALHCLDEPDFKVRRIIWSANSARAIAERDIGALLARRCPGPGHVC